MLDRRVTSWLLLLTLAFTPGGCGDDTPPPGESPLISVFFSEMRTESVQVDEELVPQNNCGGNAESSSEVERSRAVEKVIEVGSEYQVAVDGSIKIAGTGVGLGAALAAQLGVSYGVTEEIARSVTLKAAPHSYMEHIIGHQEIWQVGTARVIVGSQKLEVPYRFRVGFQVLQLDSQEKPCPGMPTRIPTHTPAPDATSSSVVMIPTETPIAPTPTYSPVPTPPTATPTSMNTPTPVPPTATPTSTNTPTPVPPTATPTPPPTDTPTPTPTPTLVPPTYTPTPVPPTATPTPTPFTRALQVMGNDEDGAVFEAPISGDYIISYVGDAYSAWKSDDPSSKGWTTMLQIYRNRPVTWGPTPYTGLTKIGPIEEYGSISPSHDTDGDTYYLDQREVIAATQGRYVSVWLNAGEYVTIVAVDERGRYFDNPGKVDIGVTFVRP